LLTFKNRISQQHKSVTILELEGVFICMNRRFLSVQSGHSEQEEGEKELHLE
jgi:hypothetical protein